MAELILPLEEWRPVIGYLGIEVSNQGNIRSYLRKQVKFLKPFKSTWGYRCIGLYKDGHRRKLRMHRLIAQAFIGSSDLEVNHKNGDKSDNRLENLEYATASENQIHCSHVLWKRIGETSGGSKLKDAQVRCVFALRKAGIKALIISRFFRIATTTIYCISRGESWENLKLLPALPSSPEKEG